MDHTEIDNRNQCKIPDILEEIVCCEQFLDKIVETSLDDSLVDEKVEPEIQINQNNAIKIKKTGKGKFLKEIKKYLKGMQCHWNEEEKAYTCDIHHKIPIETHLKINDEKFICLEDVYDEHFSLPPNKQKAERLEQAKKHIQQEGLKQIGSVKDLINDFNKLYSTALTIKSFEGVSKSDLSKLATEENPKQIDHLKYILDEFRKVEKKRLNAQELTEKITDSLSENTSCDIRYGNYIVNKSGLYFSKDGEPEWISSPIWPEAYLRDTEGKSHTLLVKIHDGERDHKITIPRRLITKWTELSDILLDLGQCVPTSPVNQKRFQDFLIQARPEKLMRCVDKSGWHCDQYIFPDGEVLGKTQDSNENVHPLNEVCPKGIEKKGSLQEWQDNVLKLCANNSRLIFSIGVSLSAPCLQLVGDEGGVFNFKGTSSIGKTRCLMVAISVFGSPKFIRSWRTTSNGLEGVCALHNDCLLALDEFGQSDAKEVGEIAYMYSQGIGKQRSSRDGSPRETKTWRGMLFSTGEIGIADHIQDAKKKAKAGQLVRVLDIPAQVKNSYGCFEELHGFVNGVDGERFAEKIKDVCGEYYGTAGRKFIKEMIEWDLEKARKYLRFSKDDFAASVSISFDGQVKRVANRFGLIYASLSLGIELNILSPYLTKKMCEDSVKQCFKDWLNERGTTGSFESHSVVSQIIGLINENADSKFIPKNEVDDKKIRNTVWGYKDGPIFYVLPKAFTEDLCKGFDEQSAKNTLSDSGLLIPDKDGKFSQSIRIPAHPKEKARFYVINLENHKDDENFLIC